jgi:cellulose synthase/poly-beta-1,6-N-acetylglucosamine synthase-like glycosyltransferase
MSKIPDLDVAKVDKILSYEELPPVSIIIPCYKRRKFVPLMLCNIFYLDYPKNKLEVCILQDGPEDLFPHNNLEYFKKNCGCAVNYKYEPNVRRTIGEKRNRLVKMASYKIVACMDSDDIYMPTYLRYSVSAIKQYKVGITSSASMMFCFPQYDYKLTGIRCGFKRQAHEACAVFTKKHFRSMGGFISKGAKGNQGEGVKMIDHNEKMMCNLDIRMLMVCVVHSVDEGNTIDKERFKDADVEGSIQSLPHLDCLKLILGTPLKEEDSEDNRSQEVQ